MIVEDDNDSDDAIIDEFLPSMNEKTMMTALTSAVNTEPLSDDDSEPRHSSLTLTLNQSRNHGDGTVCLQHASISVVNYYFCCCSC